MFMKQAADLAGAAADSEYVNVTLAKEMLTALSNRDGAGFLKYLATDVVYESPFYASVLPATGRDAFGRIVETVIDKFSAIHFDIDDAFSDSEGDRVVIECHGDNTVATTGAPYRNHYLMLLRFRNGKVIYWREFSNPDVYRTSVAD